MALPAAAQKETEVRRGDMKIIVHVRGSVVASDMIRLKSQIEGRVEDLDVSTYTWIRKNRPLGYLANKEMAAIFDSHTTTVRGVVEDRWKRVYKPSPISCPKDCFMLRVFTKSKEWLKPHALLFEAAQRLQMVGRVRPEDAQWVRDNQDLEFWPVDDPGRKMKARIAHYVLDVQGEVVDPGGTFTMEMTPERYLDPGTEWEGVIIPKAKKNVLMVPTESVLVWKNQPYVVVRVSTGITTHDFTEITAGLQEKRELLILPEGGMGEAERHKQATDPQALNERRHEISAAAAAEQEKERAAARREYEKAQREAEKELDRRRDKAASAAPVVKETQENPPPPNTISTYENQRPPRKEKIGNLPDPDATFSEAPQGE